jgi:hypothetical protein
LNYKFEKVDEKTCMYKRAYTGIGEWSSYDDGEEEFELLFPGCTIDLDLFPTNTPKQTNEDILKAIEKNIQFCSARICNLGKPDAVTDLYIALDNLRNPKTYRCNWILDKYLNPDRNIEEEEDRESVDTFEEPIDNVEYLNLSIDKYNFYFNFRFVVVRADLENEPYWIGQVVSVNGIIPRREVRVRWLKHFGKRNGLYGSGIWKLMSNFIFNF